MESHDIGLLRIRQGNAFNIRGAGKRHQCSIRGDRAVTQARFRCRDCGEVVEKQVRPPVPELGGAAGYI